MFHIMYVVTHFGLWILISIGSSVSSPTVQLASSPGSLRRLTSRALFACDVMTERNNPENKHVISHHGFSQKARGILLESHSVTCDKLPNIPDKNAKDRQAAPHRGFNEKAREILLDRKSPDAIPPKVKGSEKVRHLI